MASDLESNDIVARGRRNLLLKQIRGAGARINQQEHRREGKRDKEHAKRDQPPGAFPDCLVVVGPCGSLPVRARVDISTIYLHNEIKVPHRSRHQIDTKGHMPRRGNAGQPSATVHKRAFRAGITPAMPATSPRGPRCCTKSSSCCIALAAGFNGHRPLLAGIFVPLGGGQRSLKSERSMSVITDIMHFATKIIIIHTN